MKKILFIGICMAVFTGCFQGYDPDDSLRTVPVTNNPNIVPNHGPNFPTF
ncbi:MAG TPA: hypothetical protein VLG44_05405 [Chlamydiales bacterium]|nr:hypothetical protein [Chlamydiales bacterium]